MIIFAQGRRRRRGLSLSAILLVAGFFTAPVAAADYYVCDCAGGADAQCVVGNDAANGTSPASAWRSYDRAQDAFGALAAGDRLRFCRGGVFPVAGSTRWINSNCTAAQNCSIGAFVPTWASGDEASPRIAQSTGHGFDFGDGGDADHEEGYRVSDLDIRCSACAPDNYGFFVYNDIDDVRLERLRISGFSIGVHLAGSNPCSTDPECDGHNLRFSLVDSDILDNTSQGFLGGDSDLLIADNRFLRNGSGTVFEHNVYLAESGGATTGVRVVRNELYRSAASTSGNCEGVPLVVHGEYTDLLVEDNLIYEDIGGVAQGCWGISLTAGGNSGPEGFVRAIVRGNTIRNVGNVGIALSSCVDCIVENNRIEHQQAFGVFGVFAPALARANNDLAMTRMTVRNNSIYTTAADSVGVRVGGEGAQHVVVSNALHANYTSGPWACLSLDLPTNAYTAVDNNVCGYATGAGREWEEGSGTIGAWRTASGFDLASQAVSPGFASAGAPAHNLTAASALSPMVGAGHPTRSAPLEFYGNSRSAPPDAGAHQFGSSPSLFGNGFEVPN
ncbi:MAG: right-handed parallel beta-helix repeat-containing protein [Pseudomonadota bacterium]|nr:right-handed parallel beta-helix repeat-containing protein [Pseudomonadota bacterium]